MEKKKVLIIVAHPDDETIWLGGYILRNKNNWNLTILSLCRKDDTDRMPKFFKACKEYNAHGIISDIEDDRLNSDETQEIIKRITRLCNKDYNEIYTHSENGEYGHRRHIETNHAVKQIIKNKIIKCEKLFCFSYKKIKSSGTDTGFDAVADENADNHINLNNHEFLEKKRIIHNVYGFKKGGFEERNSRDKESFQEMKNV